MEDCNGGPHALSGVAEGRSMAATVVIVGASIAGVQSARALRAEGFTGRVVLVGQEPSLPYDKPPLSKQFLAGQWEADRIVLLDQEDAARHGVELRLGVAAAELRPDDRRVVLADGHSLAYDALVVATGASARPAPWDGASGVHVLRTLEDARSLRAELHRKARVVVVGGGFIGSEVAATARTAGCDVTVVDPLPAPLGRVVGEEVANRIAELHRRHGVVTRFGVGVESVAGAAGHLAVRLADGKELRAETVVVGIGAVPNVSWLAGSGLGVDDGLLCDEYCRAEGTTDIFAAGDVARWFDVDSRSSRRIEHWTNAVDQASCVAHNIVHPEALRAYRPVEYIWSDQYDWRIQVVGRPQCEDAGRVIGGVRDDEPMVVVHEDGDGRLAGAVVVNWPRALRECRRALAARARSDDVVARLGDLASAR